MNRAIQILILGVFALGATAALAQQGKVQLQTAVAKEQRTVDDTGETSIELVAADEVVPGDVVIYTVTYKNVSDESVENITVTNPIPPQLTYVPDSSFSPGADVQYSADGGATWGELSELVVADGDAERAATAEDLTHIRWRLSGELEPGNQGFARFRARLN
jgi:uncharacterized repeat protein (TIGR01451 family)